MATRIKLETEVDVRGAYLQGRDVPIMREFFEQAKQEVARVGITEIQQRLGKAAKHPTGRFAGAVKDNDLAKGRTIMADYPQVLYGPWLEGVSARNESTRFKGYRMFKLTRGRLRKNVGPIIQHLLDQAVAKLNQGTS